MSADKVCVLYIASTLAYSYRLSDCFMGLIFIQQMPLYA